MWLGVITTERGRNRQSDRSFCCPSPLLQVCSSFCMLSEFLLQTSQKLPNFQCAPEGSGEAGALSVNRRSGERRKKTPRAREVSRRLVQCSAGWDERRCPQLRTVAALSFRQARQGLSCNISGYDFTSICMRNCFVRTLGESTQSVQRSIHSHHRGTSFLNVCGWWMCL